MRALRTVTVAAVLAAFSWAAVAADDAPEIAPRPPDTEVEPEGYGTITAPDGTLIDLICTEAGPALMFFSPLAGAIVAPLPMWWMCIPPGNES